MSLTVRNAHGDRSVMEVTPRVLLSQSAVPMDVFKALIGVHSILQRCRDSKTIELFSEEKNLFHLVKEGVEVANTQLGIVVDLLSREGWDMGRFMFGNSTARVRW